MEENITKWMDKKNELKYLQPNKKNPKTKHGLFLALKIDHV